MLRRLLIANRGEIAVRIAATARRMGIATVAVFSDADAGALHARVCDEAVRIGPPAAADSYLDIVAVLDAAARTGADSVHPGYGFLSENAAFADAVRAAGLVFVGPPGAAIRLMGDKAAAKAAMRKAGVPVLKGHDGEAATDAELARHAGRIGYPLMVKARAGGGGRGMRMVRHAGELAESIASARREAKSAFGDDRLMLEALAQGGRHVEVQVFADRHGNVVHLFERDCTAQRRRQKVIEEAPSPCVEEGMRGRLGSWAVAAARAAGYEGAGTVEFILDAAGRPHFLEMNTRLQVEHPVTEMVTGLDLVEWQLRIAAGERLPLTQERIPLAGHAIEARLYAEDPACGFAPQTGRVRLFRPDTGGAANLRVDAGIAEGDVVHAHYDAMIAKFVAHGQDREEATRSLIALIAGNPLVGLTTNAGFLVRLLQSDAFAQAKLTTATLDEWQAAGSAVFPAPRATDADFADAAAALALMAGGDWFRSSGLAEPAIDLVQGGRAMTARLRIVRGRLETVAVGAQSFTCEQAGYRDGILEIRANGVVRRRRAIATGEGMLLQAGNDWLEFREPDLLAPRPVPDDPTRIVAPAAGVVVKLVVAEGTRVAAGDPIGAIEAMKMEMPLTARIGGVVRELSARAGGMVAQGDPLARIDPDGGEHG
jgi:geranyl-CoA carboxylase alpha subunit